jgi:adenine/guanine phosphoribosyltransferase-like PRPP-binding protein
MSQSNFIHPTTDFWQTLHTAESLAANTSFPLTPPYRYGVPLRLPDGRYLVLPVRKVAGQEGRAVASLIANQASFEVVRELAVMMAALARPFAANVFVGLPTLGLAFAPLVAEHLGHSRFVPLGYSRKFWYDDALSMPVQSLTTPGAGKRIYLDPNQLALIQRRHVVIIDDAVSTGGTLAAVIALFDSIGVNVTGVVVAMRQGTAWRERLGVERAAQVAGVVDSPRLRWAADGWWPE